MKIKHLILAVFVVVAAGFATGVAIGGKEKIVTVDRAPQVTPTPAPTPESAPTSPSSPAAEPTPGAEEPPTDDEAAAPDAVYLADVANIQPGDSVTDLDRSTSVELQDGKTNDYSTTFMLASTFADLEFYTVEIPVPQGKTRFRARIGFAKGVPTQHEVGVTFLGDKLVNGTTLREEKTLDATDDDTVNLDVSGVRTLIVRMRPELAIADSSWESPTFVLAEARFE